MSLDPLVLVIDDEQQILRALRKILSENHLRVQTASTGGEGLALAAAQPPDVVILDLGLPDMDGTVVCEQLREWTLVPIIVLSARGDQLEKARVLDKGADDYLAKPFGIEELIARIRVALRHSARVSDDRDSVVVCGAVQIDLVRRVVMRNGQEVRLTATEYKLLSYLARHADRVVTHHAILNEVWGAESIDQIEYLRVYIRQLRTKLEIDPREPQFLLTEPAVGYRLSTRNVA